MDHSALVESLQDAQRARYTMMSALTLIALDYMFTIRQEAKWIWMKKWSISKVLFIINRYATLATLLFNVIVSIRGGTSDELWVIAWTGFWSSFIIELVLLFRLWVLFFGHRSLFSVLGVLFAGQLGVMAWILSSVCTTLKVGSEPMPGMRVCYPETALAFTYAYWVANISFECILVSLSVWKAFEHIQLYRFEAFELVLSKRVGEVLVRDGLMYFPFIFIIYLVNMILWIVSPTYLGQVANAAALAMRSVLTGRLLLNVSRRFHNPDTSDAAGPVDPVANIWPTRDVRVQALRDRDNLTAVTEESEGPFGSLVTPARNNRTLLKDVWVAGEESEEEDFAEGKPGPSRYFTDPLGVSSRRGPPQ